MKLRAIFGALTLVSLVACATNPEPDTIVATAAPAAATAAAGDAVDQGETEIADATALAESASTKEVCKLIDVTGSRFKKRVCATQEQWDQQNAKTDSTNSYIRRSVRTQTGQPGQGGN